MKTGSIYGLTCICHGEVRYIGLTSRSLDRRLAEHLWEAKRKPYLPKHSWMLKHGIDNVYGLLLEDNVPLTDLPSMEILWISLFDRSRLLNLTIGGEGKFGYTHSKESREKMSMAKRGRTYDMSSKHKLNVVKAINRRYADNTSKGPLDNKAKLNYDLADDIRRMNADRKSQRSLSKEYNVSLMTIQRILRNLTYVRPHVILEKQYQSDEA